MLKVKSISEKEFLSISSYDLSMSGDLYGAYIGDKLIGRVGVRRLSWFAYEIFGLYIDKSYRGNGYAKQLLKDILSRYSGLICATIRTDNIPSLRTFFSCGFEINGKVISPRGNEVVVVVKKSI